MYLEQEEGIDMEQQLTRLPAVPRTDFRPVGRLAVKSGGRLIFVRVDDIDWVEAAGNYVRLHVGDQIHLLRRTMNRLEARLDLDRFVRIHRSSIVNIDCVRELRTSVYGDYDVLLRDGTELRLSRRYRANLLRLCGSGLPGGFSC